MVRAQCVLATTNALARWLFQENPMNVRNQRIRSRVLSVTFLTAAVFAASVIEARATCVAPAASKVSALASAAKPLRPGTPPALAAAAQSSNSNGGGPI